MRPHSLCLRLQHDTRKFLLEGEFQRAHLIGEEERSLGEQRLLLRCRQVFLIHNALAFERHAFENFVKMRIYQGAFFARHRQDKGMAAVAEPRRGIDPAATMGRERDASPLPAQTMHKECGPGRAPSYWTGPWSAIGGLASNPRPPGCLKMQGGDGLYRVRVGDYRIIYQIQDSVLTVLVVQIGNRKEIYRQ